MSKGFVQFRPRTPTPNVRTNFYNPERDLGHVGMGLVRAAAISLETRFWEPWLAQYMEDHSLKYDDLVEPLSKLANACAAVIKTANPPEALQQAGFDQLPPAIQLVIYARLGQVLLAATWEGVKDVSRPDSEPPMAVSDLYNAVEDIMQHVGKSGC